MAELVLAVGALALALLLLGGAVLSLVAIVVSGWEAVPPAWPWWTNVLVIATIFCSVIVFGLLSALLVFPLKDIVGPSRTSTPRDSKAIQQKSLFNLPARFALMGGIDFEHEVAGLLRESGYSVELTPISGDYGVDLVATKDDHRIAIQAKRWAKPVGVKAVSEVHAGKDFYDAQEAWVVSTNRFNSRAKELAKRTRVRLIDGEEFAGWLNRGSAS
jgi:HJR/Mrr/RecB family endonuclease